MSTNLKKFHLSSECRSILYRLMRECEFQLDKDIVEGFPHPSRTLGNLLPLIYQAFMKVWCQKITFICRKSEYSPVSFSDTRSIRIDFEFYRSLLKCRAELEKIRKGADSYSDLPF